MATVEFLKKRVAGKEKEIATLQKKLERIYKAQASNWENNPYWYSESDIKHTLRDIEIAEHQLSEYRLKLESQVEKDNSRDVKPILDFLNDWKTRVFNHYKAGLSDYFTDYEAIRLLDNRLSELEAMPRLEREYFEVQRVKLDLAEARAKFREAQEGKYVPIPKTDPSYRKWYNEKRKIETGKYEWLRDYFCYSSLDEALSVITKLLEQEANAKYDDIIERTNKIVGQITDASYLTIGEKGDLNGYIIGTRGKASVTTIGAGGHSTDYIVNVKHGQIFHFRTLIKEMK